MKVAPLHVLHKSRRCTAHPNIELDTLLDTLLCVAGVPEEYFCVRKVTSVETRNYLKAASIQSTAYMVVKAMFGMPDLSGLDVARQSGDMQQINLVAD